MSKSLWRVVEKPESVTGFERLGPITKKNTLDTACIAGYQIGVDEGVDKGKAALTAALKY
jgi:hypothetical protein